MAQDNTGKKRNVIRMNESQLRAAVRKCIAESVSELGDTPEGRAALANAVTKANSLGRFGQMDTFMNGLHDAVATQYGKGATNSYFEYDTDRRKVRVFRDGRLLLANLDGSNKGEEDLGKFVENGWNGMKTRDRATARRLSKWCGEFLDKNLPYYEKCLDWHTWALQ